MTPTSVEERVDRLELVLIEIVEALQRLGVAAESARGAKWKVQYPTIHGQQTMIVEKTA